MISVVEPAAQGSKLTVEPGDKFELDVIVTSNAGDTFQTCAFNVNFTFPKEVLYLIYQGYTWSEEEFVTGGGDDRSTPAGGNIVGPDGKISFDNLTREIRGVPQRFGVGTLVTLNLGVPVDFFESSVPPGDPLASIQIDPKPGFFGFLPFPITAEKFTLNVVPEPATLAQLSLVGSAAALRRRRSA